MKLTTRGHYSVKALLELSLNAKNRPLSVRTIAERQDIPAPYLEKLLIELRKAGLVASSRGAQGGYYLARPTAQISLGEVLDAVGETLEPLPSQTLNPQHSGDWVTFSLWKRLHFKMKEALYGVSLEDLYYDARSWQASQGQDAVFTI